MNYKIQHDVPGCIGCGACAALCPEFFTMQGAKAKLIKSECSQDKLESVKEAAESCPVNVIHIIDDTEKKII
jgi:ferredoxin